MDNAGKSKFVEVPIDVMTGVETLCANPRPDAEKLARFKQMLENGLPINARASADMEEAVGFKTIIEVACAQRCEPVLLYMLRHDPFLVNYPKRLFAEVAPVPAAVRQLLEQGLSIKDAIAEFPHELLGDIIDRAHPETLRILVDHGVDLDANVLAGGKLVAPVLHHARVWVSEKFNDLARLGCKMSASFEENGYSVMHVMVTGFKESAPATGPWAVAFKKSLLGPEDTLLASFKTRVELALEAGADINAVDYKRQTALHLAAKLGIVDKLKVLLEAGGNIDLLDWNGQTALMLALAAGKSEAAQAILAHKAQAAILSVTRRAGEPQAPA